MGELKFTLFKHNILSDLLPVSHLQKIEMDGKDDESRRTTGEHHGKS